MRRWRQIHPPPLLDYARPDDETISLYDRFLDIIDDLGGPLTVLSLGGICAIFSGMSVGGFIGALGVLTGGVALWKALGVWERSSRW